MNHGESMGVTPDYLRNSGTTPSNTEELDDLYNPEITDLESDEYHGINRPAIYLDDAKAAIERLILKKQIEARIKQLTDCLDIVKMQLGGSKEVGVSEVISLFSGYREQ